MAETSWRAFHQMIADNPHVWDLFERYTFDRIERGFSKYGAAQVLGRVRWDTALPLEDGSQFKVNNNWGAFFSRHFNDLHPTHVGFFELRKSIADRPGDAITEDPYDQEP